MTHRINARYLSDIMDITADELLALPFYSTLLDFHISYADGKCTDMEYSKNMDALIASHPAYAENLGHLKTRLLAHI